jgi:co-chaperonin GroES (HSP10)
MKTLPLGKQIQLKIDNPSAGVLDTSSRSTMVEHGTVLAVGPEVTIKVQIGDKVLVKSWAVDSVKYGEAMLYFIHQDSAGLLAIVK